MYNNFEYGFWFWSRKLDGIIRMLSYLSDYDIIEEEILSIELGLIGTSDEENIWTDYFLQGSKFKIDLRFSYDTEEGEDMIHIRIRTSDEIKDKIEMLNLFQCMFKNLEIE